MRDLRTFSQAVVLTLILTALTTATISYAGLSCTVTTVCNSPSVVVFRMSSTTNAHAELPNQSNYSQLVCCSGIAGLGNSCSGINTTVLKLASTTNSHVEENSGITYTNNACLSVSAGYTFSVGYVSGSCSGYDTALASISNAGGNAHMGTSSVYTTEVCASAVASSLTFTTDSSTETFPAQTPGTLVATSSILNVTTSNSTGFNVTVQRASATATMSLGGSGVTFIPEKTDWINGANTSTAGNATASTSQPLTLQFRMRKIGTDAADYASAWWGTDDSTANALFGGISSTTQTIINRSTSAVSATTDYVLYNLNTPVAQKTGTYSGSMTYTATANP
jgi:hypothetical protein